MRGVVCLKLYIENDLELVSEMKANENTKRDLKVKLLRETTVAHTIPFFRYGILLDRCLLEPWHG